jgi:hypothetical protein
MIVGGGQSIGYLYEVIPKSISSTYMIADDIGPIFSFNNNYVYYAVVTKEI